MEEEVFRDQRGDWSYMQPTYMGVYVFTLSAVGIFLSQESINELFIALFSLLLL